VPILRDPCVPPSALLVHVIEGYYCEIFLHLRHTLTCKGASNVIAELEAAPPKIVLHIGTAASGVETIEGWEGNSSSTPDLSQFALTTLKIEGEYSADDESSASYRDQINHFRTLHCRNSTEEIQEQLIIPGFSDFSHKNAARSIPILHTLVAKAHPIANSVRFWACHMSVVLALPYRIWWSSSTARVTQFPKSNDLTLQHKSIQSLQQRCPF